MLRLAYSWCGDSMLAEDLVQESFAKAIKNHKQLKDQDKLKCWLFSILNNCWREHLRKARNMTDIDDLVFISAENIESDASSRQTVQKVRQAIAELPLGQRQVVTLVDLMELSYAEVAMTLEIPTGTVMSRLNRARETLKVKLLSYATQANISCEAPTHLRRVK